VVVSSGSLSTAGAGAFADLIPVLVLEIGDATGVLAFLNFGGVKREVTRVERVLRRVDMPDDSALIALSAPAAAAADFLTRPRWDKDGSDEA
jgi:hypothetical protein